MINPIYYATVAGMLPGVDKRVLHERNIFALRPSECG